MSVEGVIEPAAQSAGPSARRGLIVIAASTAVAGLGGYLVTTLGARALGPSGYAVFAVFWGALYLVVGSLAGFQQELSRATSATSGRAHGASSLLVRFIGGSAPVVAATLGVGLLIVTPLVFPSEGWSLAAPLLVGAVAYVGVAIATGVLYGVFAWHALAVIIMGDVLLRALGFIVATLVDGGVVTFAWATVVPFPAVFAILIMLLVRRGSTFRFDVGWRALAMNSLRTVAAGIGASALVSGFPLLIGLAAGTGDEVGVLVYVLVLARAPLVVTTMALQSYLVVVLRRRRERVRATVVLLGVIGGVGAVATAGAWFVGPWLVELLAGPAYLVAPAVPALLVLVSITTGWLAVTGSAVLASGDHASYAAGWTVAAAVAIVVLFALPGEPLLRISVALAIGPVVGVAFQFVRIVRGGADRAASDYHR